MSNYHRDDGTFSSGLIVGLAIVLSFAAGYWVRDQGIRVQVQIPQVRGVK